MKTLGTAVLCLVAAVIGGLLVWIVLSYATVSFPGSRPSATLEIAYSDFISIMLTLVTVILAAVAIGVGVVASYTISSLEKRADAAVDDRVKERLSKLDEELRRRAFSGTGAMGSDVGDFDIAGNEDDQEDR